MSGSLRFCSLRFREDLAALMRRRPALDAPAPTDAVRARASAYAEKAGLWLDDFVHLDAGILRTLFGFYDEVAFDGLLSRALPEGCHGEPGFRWSNRMTSAAGKTTSRAVRLGPFTRRRTEWVEIALSRPLLTEPIDAVVGVEVTGLVCLDRFAVLQRVFEHELVHVLMLCLEFPTSCRQHPFRTAAARLFGHYASHHRLVVAGRRTARAAADTPGSGGSPIRPGDRVRFEFRGTIYEGRVNRITKRATVLVEDSGGHRYSDGCTYRKYYVPLPLLQRVA